VATYAYIDGFNLYHGAVKGTKLKWLDVLALCQSLYPNQPIDLIRYFTAWVKPLTHDTKATLRQGMYLRALRTIPNLHICTGYFLSKTCVFPQFPFAYLNPNRPPLTVQINKMEEKGTDVNLASYLLLDCFENKFDDALVISNDSDLIFPIEMVVKKYNRKVHVFNPHRSRSPNQRLIKVATSYTIIDPKILPNCQFPDPLTDSKGQFTKPPTW